MRSFCEWEKMALVDAGTNGTETAVTRLFARAYTDPTKVVLEGYHPARHAVRFGAELETAVTYDRERLLELARRTAPSLLEPIERHLSDVERTVFEKLCQRKLTSPLLAVTAHPRRAQPGTPPPEKPMLFLERPRNPGNVGAVIRVAAAADAGAVRVSGELDPWSPVVIRAAAGLQFAVDVDRVELATLPADRPLVALDAGGEPLKTSELDPASILAIGGERYGISDSLRSRADRTIALPMRDGVSSLNLATAISAVLYAWKTACRERTGATPW